MSKSKPTITNIDIQDVTYDLDKHFGQIKQHLLELLPTKKRQTIEFVINNSNTRLANAIRRTLIEELPVKILHVNLEDIEKDEEFLILDEFIDRLNAIHIDQSTPDTATFRLDVVNTDMEKRISHVYSGQIEGLGNKAESRCRIAELSPGKHLRAENIHIKTGYGYDHISHSLTCGITYKPIDYVNVSCINNRGFIEKGMALTSYVLPLAKKSKSSLNNRTIHDERILFVPDPKLKEMVSSTVRGRLENFSIQIAKDVQFHSSANSHPSTFYMKVETYGTIEPRALMKMACVNIRDRLQAVHDGLEPYLKDARAEPSNVNVIVNVMPNRIEVRIIGETHTIGEMLIYNVWRLDPAVGNVKKRLTHQLDREVVLTVMHAQPVRILMDACQLGMDDVTAVSNHF